MNDVKVGFQFCGQRMCGDIINGAGVTAVHLEEEDPLLTSD